MVPLRTIRSDYFEFDEERYRLVGKHTGIIYTLGDRVKIKVKSTNLEQKLLDYELVEPETSLPPKTPSQTPAGIPRHRRPSKRRG